MNRLIKNYYWLVILISLVIFGFLLRFWGLTSNPAFWTDENHAAIFARAITERGWPRMINGYTTGAFQLLLYWLIALSMKMFGINELAARLPSVIFGTGTILAVYLLGEKLFGRKTGLISALITSFLTTEILWSRQARPYQGLQFFLVLGAYFIYRSDKLKGHKNWLLAVFCGIMASLLHGTGLVFFAVMLIYLLFVRFDRRYILQYLLVTLAFIMVGAFNWRIILNTIRVVGQVNNLFYYRHFLIHNYWPLLILGFFGFIGMILAKKHRELILIGIFIGLQTLLCAFVFNQPFIRYIYIIFPFIIIVSGYGTAVILGWLNKKSKLMLMVMVAGLMLMTGWGLKNNKITLIPKNYYSMNNDMQEIPEVDWKKIYNFVGDGLNANPGTILITNWNDQPIWYFGEKFADKFIMVRKTVSDRIYTDPVFGERIIYSTKELEEIKQQHPKGLLIVDSWDNEVPDDYRDYVFKNFQLKMELDRLYPVQPRYWTVWVYGWGIP